MKYETFKSENPGTNYADYAVSREAKGVRINGAHESLGRNIEQRSMDQAKVSFRYFEQAMQMDPSDRVIEYGCGSLRVGRHVIDYIDPGNYLGLDVVADFYEIGRELVGEHVISGKKPTFDVITKESIKRHASFGANHVIACSVVYHIHPDDILDSLANLAALTCRPGAKLMFDAKVTRNDMPFRYAQSDGKGGWAWPIAFYQAALKPLELIMIRDRSKYTWAPEVDFAHLVFQAPYAMDFASDC